MQHSLPLYTAQQSRELDALAIEQYVPDGYTLMNRAGEAVFRLIQDHYPLCKCLVVCCGAGNNAGDGYVVARLAHRAGMDVDIISLVDSQTLRGEAAQAYADWRKLGIHPVPATQKSLQRADVIVDALLGTGINKPVEGEFLHLIGLINQSDKPVIAVDLPSGLNADNGIVMGAAVQATYTLSFIGRKRGLYTAQAVDYCGDRHFDALDLPDSLAGEMKPSTGLLEWQSLRQLVGARKRNAHKGDFGHLLVVGGNHGMQGAAIMAGVAALRAGAGRVTLAGRSGIAQSANAYQPELMTCELESSESLNRILNQVDAIVIGPGLGKDDWAREILARVIETECPMIVDADALNLLAEQSWSRRNNNWIVTPHPGEAARLLGTSTVDIQQNRFASIELLQSKLGGCVILKGAGSLVRDSQSITYVCPYGNPGMATAGMGDVLSGLLGALVVQGYDLLTAAQLGVCVHALAADDTAATHGERGLLATDLFRPMQRRLNPGAPDA